MDETVRVFEVSWRFALWWMHCCYYYSMYRVGIKYNLFCKFTGGKERIKCILSHIFRHHLFDLRQKERNELRLVVELKWKRK